MTSPLGLWIAVTWSFKFGIIAIAILFWVEPKVAIFRWDVEAEEDFMIGFDWEAEGTL